MIESSQSKNIYLERMEAGTKGFLPYSNAMMHECSQVSVKTAKIMDSVTFQGENDKN